MDKFLAFVIYAAAALFLGYGVYYVFQLVADFFVGVYGFFVNYFWYFVGAALVPLFVIYGPRFYATVVEAYNLARAEDDEKRFWVSQKEKFSQFRSKPGSVTPNIGIIDLFSNFEVCRNRVDAIVRIIFYCYGVSRDCANIKQLKRVFGLEIRDVPSNEFFSILSKQGISYEKADWHNLSYERILLNLWQRLASGSIVLVEGNSYFLANPNDTSSSEGAYVDTVALVSGIRVAESGDVLVRFYDLFSDNPTEPREVNPEAIFRAIHNKVVFFEGVSGSCNREGSSGKGRQQESRSGGTRESDRSRVDPRVITCGSCGEKIRVKKTRIIRTTCPKCGKKIRATFSDL